MWLHSAGLSLGQKVQDGFQCFKVYLHVTCSDLVAWSTLPYSQMTKFLIGAFQKDKLQNANAQILCFHQLANAALAKLSHRSKPRFSMGGDYKRAGTGSQVYFTFYHGLFWSMMIHPSHMQNKFMHFQGSISLISLCSQAQA